MGPGAIAAAENSFAFGSSAAITDNSLAIGHTAIVGGEGGMAIGTLSNANKNGIAYGINALAVADDAIAIGNNVRAGNEKSIALGYYNKEGNNGGLDELTFFTLGNGLGGGNVRNSLEIKKNDDMYIVGIGGYTGANSDPTSFVDHSADGWTDNKNPLTGKKEHTVKTLQETIELLEAKVANLENIITKLTELIEP